MDGLQPTFSGELGVLVNSQPVNEIDIGYMQVHLRIYAKGELYESFAINAEDGCFTFNTELLSSYHEVINNPAKTNEKIFQINIKIFETNSSILMHMSIHQSNKWEIIKGTDIYTVGFFCNLGKRGIE